MTENTDHQPMAAACEETLAALQAKRVQLVARSATSAFGGKADLGLGANSRAIVDPTEPQTIAEEKTKLVLQVGVSSARD